MGIKGFISLSQWEQGEKSPGFVQSMGPSVVLDLAACGQRLNHKPFSLNQEQYRLEFSPLVLIIPSSLKCWLKFNLIISIEDNYLKIVVVYAIH